MFIEGWSTQLYEKVPDKKKEKNKAVDQAEYWLSGKIRYPE
jgi:hypothetical protein